MARIVITGGSGLLGLNWALYALKEHEVHLWLHQRSIALTGVNSRHVDLNVPSAITTAINDIKPDIIINTSGYTSVDGCESNASLSKRANFDNAKNLAMAAALQGVKFVHISTDHLFDGLTSFVVEDTPTNPQNIYAQHKAMAEEVILRHHPQALILRTTFFGWGPSYRRSFSDLILDDLKIGRQVKIFDDVFFTPVNTSYLITMAHRLIDQKATGVINVCGGERISKYDFSVRLAKAFGYDPSTIQPIQASRLRYGVKRPRDLSLSNAKMNQILDLKPVNIDSSISALKNEQHLAVKMAQIGQIIPYGKHYIDDDDVKAVENTLKSGLLTQGPAIPEFERRVAEYTGAKYAVAVSSATAGLHLAYMALGVGPNKTVLTSPITFVSTANAAYFCGSQARFADIDPDTVNVSLNAVKDALDDIDDIHVVAPVLFSGAADGIPEVAQLAKSRGKFVVEDAAHGLGGSYVCGSKIGSCKYSDCTVFSLHPVKSIAAGEGGIITTNSVEVYKTLLRLRSHGINKNDDAFLHKDEAYTDGKVNHWYYEMTTLGYHYRITDIQASLANSQLDKLDHFVARRRELAHQYTKWLNTIDGVWKAQDVDINNSANHLYIVDIDFQKLGFSRNHLMSALRQDNIITQVHYIPVVMNPFYAQRGHDISDYPNSFSYYKNCLSIPLYYSLTDQDRDHFTKLFEQALV
jgi:UDP-4-amino-4,6-dideoxy-N-acetyl-beta-L-altrosamine transaminase/dTDP-4-dehydrorhamnose reductase